MVCIGAAFWTNRTSWSALRAAAVAAEWAGFDSLWFDDHLLADEGDPSDPKLDGWTALAALSQATTRARLGLLVSANSLRPPGLTAKLAVTLDHLSGGRAVLGLGSGWLEREHDAFGIPFGSGFGERLDRLDEATFLIRRLLDGERVTHAGRFYSLHDAVCAPRPLQARLPILIGGSGPTKTLRTTARYADLWNGYGDAARIAQTLAILDQRCEEVGRDPAAIERSVTQEVVVRDTVAAAHEAYRHVARIHGILEAPLADDGTVAALAFGGPPELVADGLRPFLAAGVGHLMWVFRQPFDHETIARVGEVRALLG